MREGWKGEVASSSLCSPLPSSTAAPEERHRRMGESEKRLLNSADRRRMGFHRCSCNILVWCGFYWRWCKALVECAGLAVQEEHNPAPFCFSTELQSFSGDHAIALHIAPSCGFREPPNTSCSLGVSQACSSVGKWCTRLSAGVEDSGCSPQ